jgi:hypothetical protein
MNNSILSSTLFGMIVLIPSIAIAQNDFDYLPDDYINITTQVVTQDVISPVPIYHQYSYVRTYYPHPAFFYPMAPQPVVVINRFNGPYYYSPCPGKNFYQTLPNVGVDNGPSTDNNYCW